MHRHEIKSTFQEAEELLKNKHSTEALEKYAGLNFCVSRDDEMKTKTYIGMMQCYYDLLLLGDVKRIADELVSYELDEITSGKVHMHKATACWMKGEYKEADKICQNILEKIKNPKVECRVKSLLGMIYADIYLVSNHQKKEIFLQKAIKESEEAYQLATSTGGKYRRAHNMAWVMYLKEDYKKGEKYIKEARSYIDGNILYEAVSLNMWGLIKIGEGKLDEAKEFLDKASEHLYTIGNSATEYFAQNYHYRAKLLYVQGYLLEAEEYFKSALDLSKEKLLIRDVVLFYLEMYRIYDGVDKEKALKAYAEYQKYKENISWEERD